MSAILLPASPGPASAQPQYIDWGNVLPPALSGPSLRLDRPGSRHAVDFTMPLMAGTTAMAWIQRLKRGLSDEVRMKYPLIGVSQAGGDGLAVSASVTGGTSLAITGGTPGAAVKEGQWVNVIRAGKYYLYSQDSDLTLDGSGAGTLTLTPMLRTPVTAGVDTVNLSTIYIEGFPIESPHKWTLDVAKTLGLQFTIGESA